MGLSAVVRAGFATSFANATHGSCSRSRLNQNSACRGEDEDDDKDEDDDEDEDEDEDGEDDDNSNDDDDDDDDFFKSGQGSPSLDHRSTAAMTLGKSLWVNGAITAIEGGIAAAMPWDSALPRRFPPTK